MLTLLVSQEEEYPACKIEWWGVDVVICLEWGAGSSHMVQLMPLPSQNPIFSCLVWIQTGSNFLVPAYPGCSGKEAVKWYSSSSICKGPTTVWPLVTVNAAPCCRSFNRLPVIEVLSCHIDSIASCLRSAHCDCVIVLRLLSLLHLPSNADISCLTRLSHHVVFCFFTTMRRRGKSSFLVFSLNAYVHRVHTPV